MLKWLTFLSLGVVSHVFWRCTLLISFFPASFFFPHHVFHLYVCAWTDLLEARFDLNDPTSLLSFACFFFMFLDGLTFLWCFITACFFMFFGWIDLLSVLPNLFFASFRLLLLYFHFDLTFTHWKALLKQDLIAWEWPSSLCSLSCMDFWASKIIHCFLIFLLRLMSMDWHSNALLFSVAKNC